MNDQPPPTLDAEEKYQELLRRRLDTLRQQKRLQTEVAAVQRAEAMTYAQSPQYVRDRLSAIQEERRLIADRHRAEQAVRSADLRSQYGSFRGGLYARAEQFHRSRFGQTAGAGVTAFGAAVGAGARSGFSGTVEQNRMSYEMTLLNRELAGAFKPLIELFTSGVTKVRKFLETLSPSGQNVLMYGGIAAGAYGLTRMGGRMLGGLAGGMFGGMPGALAGASLLGRGGGDTPSAPRPLRPDQTASSWRKNPPPVVTPPDQSPRRNPRVATGGMYAAAAVTAVGTFETASHMRNAYNSDNPDERLKHTVAGVRSNPDPLGVMGWMMPAGGKTDQELTDLEKKVGKPGDEQRRRVTPDQFGYEQAGSAYRRASVSFLSTTAAQDSGGGEWMGMAGKAAAGGVGAKGGNMEGAMKVLAAAIDQLAANVAPKAEVR